MIFKIVFGNHNFEFKFQNGYFRSHEYRILLKMEVEKISYAYLVPEIGKTSHNWEFLCYESEVVPADGKYYRHLPITTGKVIKNQT